MISFIRFCRDLVVVLSLLFESVEISVSGGLGLSIVFASGWALRMVAKCASKVCAGKYIESKRLDALTDTWNMGNIRRFDSRQTTPMISFLPRVGWVILLCNF